MLTKLKSFVSPEMSLLAALVVTMLVAFGIAVRHDTTLQSTEADTVYMAHCPGIEGIAPVTDLRRTHEGWQFKVNGYKTKTDLRCIFSEALPTGVSL